MPYQVLPQDQRQRQPVQAIAAPPVAQPPAAQAPVVAPRKTALRQFGDAAFQTARGISNAVGSLTVGPAIDLGTAGLALATGNDPRTRPGGVMATTAAYNAAAKDAEQQVFGGTGQAIQKLGGEITGTKPFTPPAPAPAPAAPKPATPTAAPPNQPAPQQAIATPPQTNFTEVPSQFKDGGFVQSTSGPSGREEGERYLATRERERDNNLQRRDAQIDASIANANQQSIRNQLISEFNRTPPGGGMQRPGEFRPRGGGDPRLALAQQITALSRPIAPVATPTATQQQKDTAEIDAAGAKAKSDAVQNEAQKLALQGATRKDKIQQQIAELGGDTAKSGALRATLAALEGKDPNADRFQSIEEIVGTDQFGTPIKVRSLYDTRTGAFVNRPGAQGAQKPSQDFEEGKVYQDANGNKAKYKDGKFVPVS